MGSQTSSSTSRIALAIGVVGLILGASGLGYAVYLGQSQLPSQLSAATVNVTPSGKNIRVEWTTSFDAGQDRFEPQYITVAQGDNLNITLITNDTSDAHTFTIFLALAGLGQSAKFQLNNSYQPMGTLLESRTVASTKMDSRPPVTHKKLTLAPALLVLATTSRSRQLRHLHVIFGQPEYWVWQRFPESMSFSVSTTIQLA